MTARLSPTERYRTDVNFRNMVNMLYNLVAEAQFTPTEIREAAMLAQIKYEELNIRTLIIEDGWPVKF